MEELLTSAARHEIPGESENLVANVVGMLLPLLVLILQKAHSSVLLTLGSSERLPRLVDKVVSAGKPFLQYTPSLSCACLLAVSYGSTLFVAYLLALSLIFLSLVPTPLLLGG